MVGCMGLDPTSVDLLTLTGNLARLLEAKVLRRGYLSGKTVLRDAVMSLLACSELEAEQIVDTLEARGFVRFREEPGAPDEGAWLLRTVYT
jgi:hypothetical protein